MLLLNITIPAKKPPGEYLLRFEQFWGNPYQNLRQWFPNCAQINDEDSHACYMYLTQSEAHLPTLFGRAVMGPGGPLKSFSATPSGVFARYACPGPAWFMSDCRWS
jgi:hypothetical protein